MKIGFPSIFGGLTKKGAEIRARVCLMLGTGLVMLSACAAPQPSATINDPDEARNREIHAFNVGLDKAFVRPVSKAYGTVAPGPVQQGVANFASNLDLPGDVVNGLAQGRPHHAFENTLRFGINSTIGILGLFDPAKLVGLPGKHTDFGETLHVWGAGEGQFVELPVLGPSTERDAFGKIVDIVINPVSAVVKAPESYVVTGANVASKLGDRAQFSQTIDSILYDSADGYAQTRLLYLQKRRYDLGQTAAADDSLY